MGDWSKFRVQNSQIRKNAKVPKKNRQTKSRNKNFLTRNTRQEQGKERLRIVSVPFLIEWPRKTDGNTLDGLAKIFPSVVQLKMIWPLIKDVP